MILPVLAWIGFFSMIAQVLLMRELLVSFEGNELSLGIVLGGWLIWTGIGSAAWGMVAKKLTATGLFASLLACSGLVFPLTLVAARLLPLFLERTPGELSGPSALLYPFLLLLPLCLLSGGLFSAATAALSGQRGAAQAAGRVYLLEAAGGGVAGVISSFLLTGILPLSIATVIGFGNLVLAACILAPRRRLVLAVVFLAGCPLLVWLAGQAEQQTFVPLWRGYKVVESVSSPYGRLALVEAEGEPIVFHDRVALFGEGDEQAIEEKIHYPLLEHPAPEEVLLLGGGSPAALRNILKHRSVRRLDYLEADPGLIALFRRHLAQKWVTVSSDSRVRIHRADARRFVRASNEHWDLIIIGLPPPHTVLINRYYTAEFFEEARKRLSPGGIIALQVPGAENYISEDLARFLACIRKTLSSVFPHVVLLPGSNVQFFGSVGPADSLTSDPKVLTERLKHRALQSLYVREYTIPFRLTPDRLSELDRQTRIGPKTPVNRDFSPVAYYLEFVFWTSIFGERYRAFFSRLSTLPYWLICSAAGLLVMVPLLIGLAKRKRDLAARAIESCVATMGLTMLGLQVVLLLGFQACYGFLFQQLGLLTGAFMFGMALGALLGTRMRVSRNLLPALHLSVCLWLAVVYFGFKTAAATNSFLAPYVLFAGLSLLTGLVGGWHFYVASAAWLKAKQGSGSLGTVYAVDLTGAAVGAIAVAAFLLPVFGYAGTAGVLVVVNLVAVAGLWAFR